MKRPIPNKRTSFQCKPEIFKLIEGSSKSLNRDKSNQINYLLEIALGIRDGQDKDFLKWLERQRLPDKRQEELNDQEVRLQDLLETLVVLKREQINRKHRWDEDEGELAKRKRVLKDDIATLENEIDWTRYALDELPTLTKRRFSNCRLK